MAMLLCVNKKLKYPGVYCTIIGYIFYIVLNLLSIIKNIFVLGICDNIVSYVN